MFRKTLISVFLALTASCGGKRTSLPDDDLERYSHLVETAQTTRHFQDIYYKLPDQDVSVRTISNSKGDYFEAITPIYIVRNGELKRSHHYAVHYSSTIDQAVKTASTWAILCFKHLCENELWDFGGSDFLIDIREIFDIFSNRHPDLCSLYYERGLLKLVNYDGDSSLYKRLNCPDYEVPTAEMVGDGSGNSN